MDILARSQTTAPAMAKKDAGQDDVNPFDLRDAAIQFDWAVNPQE
jgi:hypothetical protein